MTLEVGSLQVEFEAALGDFRRGVRDVNRLVDRLDNQVNTKTNSIGKRFKTAAKGVASFGAALTAATAAASAFAAVRVGLSAIRTASEFELLNARLKVLTGSVENGKQAFEAIQAVVTQTPFGFQDTGNAAAQLSVIFGENVNAIEEFTAVAADIAAATAIPINEVAGQIQRVVLGGLGAADLFRDRGVSPLIRQLAGVGPTADVSADQAIKALQQLTQSGGKFANAAAEQVNTLGGAISNSSVALEVFRKTLGDAASVPIVEFLNEKFQPAFAEVGRTIERNRESIEAFAKRGVKLAEQAFKGLLRATSFVLRGLDGLSRGFLAIRAVAARLQAVIVGLINGFNLVVAGARSSAAILSGDVTRGLEIWDEAQALAVSRTNRARIVIEELDKEAVTSKSIFGDLADGIDGFTGALERATTAQQDLGREIKRGQDLTDATPDRDAKGGGLGAGTDPLKGLRNRQAQAAGAVVQAERDRLFGIAQAAGPVQEELFLLDEQIRTLRGNLRLAGLDEGSNQALQALRGRRARLQGSLGGGTRGLFREIGESTESAIGDAFTALAQDDLVAFTDTLGDLTNEAMDNGISGVLDALSQDLDNILGAVGRQIGQSLGGGGALSGVLGGVFQLGGSLLRNAFSGGTEKFSQAANNLSQAVDDVQAARGVVAGPRDIAIATVGESIERANRGVERRLDVLIDLGNRAVAGAGANNPATLDPELDSGAVELATTSASLI